MMCDKDLLVGYLYGELEPAEQRAFSAHLTSCAKCRAEVEGLRATRVHLPAWTPPAPDFGLRIVRNVEAPPPARRFRVAPVWGLAAAAVLVLAAAAAIANLEVTFGTGGITIRTGRGVPQPPAQTMTALPGFATPKAWSADLEAIKARLQGLEAELAVRAASAPAAPRTIDGDRLRQVHQLIQESERRQQRELALRIRQVIHDVDVARYTDLAHIQERLLQTQGLTEREVKRQGDILNQFIYRVNLQR
jgi:anti-sigma factor RsiW